MEKGVEIEGKDVDSGAGVEEVVEVEANRRGRGEWSRSGGSGRCERKKTWKREKSYSSGCRGEGSGGGRRLLLSLWWWWWWWKKVVVVASTES